MLVPADGGESTTLDFGSTREVDGNTQVVCRRNGKDVFWVNNRAETVLGKAPVRWREPESPVRDLGRRRPGARHRRGLLGPAPLLRPLDLRGRRAADATSVQERLTALTGLEAVAFDLMDPGTVEMGRVKST